nr:protease pro-enzyme activation domain-containing protein [Angustibacter aerolatus]
MHRRSTIAVAVAAAAIAVPGALSATAAQAATGGARVAVANAQPQQVRGARATGTPRATQRVAVRLYLAGQSQAALAARAARVSNPSDALYHHYLTPAQVRAAYAPSTAAVQRAESFLKGAGLSIGEVPSNRAFVTASGTVAAVQKAFGTTLRTYTVGGHAVRAAATAPTVPAALQHDVLAVSGLASVGSLMTTQQAGKERAKAAPSSARRLAKGTQAPPPEAFVNAGPCSTYASEKIAKNLPSAYSEKQPYAQCGQVPAQAAGRLRSDPLDRQGLRRPWRHRRDHRRLRRADHRGRREHLRHPARPEGLRRRAADPVAAGGRVPLRLRRRRERRPVRRAGLVRRGDARRRGSARRGPGRHGAVRRGRRLRQRRLRRGHQPRRGRPPGRRRHELVGRHRREQRLARASTRCTRRSSTRPRSRASATTSRPATRATGRPTTTARPPCSRRRTARSSPPSGAPRSP